jgi:hypothetical protein
MFLTVEELRRLLPDEEPLEYMGRHFHWQGRAICPLPLTIHADLEELLSVQADMECWHLPPLDGPTDDWPGCLLDALRHVRGVIGTLQLKRYQEREGRRE